MSNSAEACPDLRYELELRAQGLQAIAGLDEAGRGALAGPVVAAAVILPLDRFDLARKLEAVRDSKQLSHTQRAQCEQTIRSLALSLGIGHATAQEIDELGILPCTRLAMSRALEVLTTPPEYLLIDYVKLPELSYSQTAIPRGDVFVLSIACASIIAKQARDRLMIEFGTCYPEYGFASHKGYGTAHHRSALGQHGPSPIHRLSFASVLQPATEA